MAKVLRKANGKVFSYYSGWILPSMASLLQGPMELLAARFPFPVLSNWIPLWAIGFFLSSWMVLELIRVSWVLEATIPTNSLINWLPIILIRLQLSSCRNAGKSGCPSSVSSWMAQPVKVISAHWVKLTTVQYLGVWRRKVLPLTLINFEFSMSKLFCLHE